jgi:hypothetical protein
MSKHPSPGQPPTLDPSFSYDALLKAIGNKDGLTKAKILSSATSILTESCNTERGFYAPNAVYPTELCVLVEHSDKSVKHDSLSPSDRLLICRKFPRFSSAAYWYTHNRGIRFEFRSLEDKNEALMSVPSNAGGDREFKIAPKVKSSPPIVLHFKQCPPIDLAVRVNLTNVPSFYMDLDDNEIKEFLKTVALLPGEENSILSVTRVQHDSDIVHSAQLHVCFAAAPCRFVIQDKARPAERPNAHRPVFPEPSYPALNMFWQWGHSNKVCPHCHGAGHVFSTCPFSECPFEGSDVFPLPPPAPPPEEAQPPSDLLVQPKSAASAPPPAQSRHSAVDRNKAAARIIEASHRVKDSRSKNGLSLVLTHPVKGPLPKSSDVPPFIRAAVFSVSWKDLPSKPNKAQLVSVMNAVNHLSPESLPKILGELSIPHDKVPEGDAPLIDLIVDTLLEVFWASKRTPVLESSPYSAVLRTAHWLVSRAIETIPGTKPSYADKASAPASTTPKPRLSLSKGKDKAKDQSPDTTPPAPPPPPVAPNVVGSPPQDPPASDPPEVAPPTVDPPAPNSPPLASPAPDPPTLDPPASAQSAAPPSRSSSGGAQDFRVLAKPKPDSPPSAGPTANPFAVLSDLDDSHEGNDAGSNISTDDPKGPGPSSPSSSPTTTTTTPTATKSASSSGAGPAAAPSTPKKSKTGSESSPSTPRNRNRAGRKKETIVSSISHSPVGKTTSKYHLRGSGSGK